MPGSISWESLPPRGRRDLEWKTRHVLAQLYPWPRPRLRGGVRDELWNSSMSFFFSESGWKCAHICRVAFKGAPFKSWYAPLNVIHPFGLQALVRHRPRPLTCSIIPRYRHIIKTDEWHSEQLLFLIWLLSTNTRRQSSCASMSMRDGPPFLRVLKATHHLSKWDSREIFVKLLRTLDR